MNVQNAQSQPRGRRDQSYEDEGSPEKKSLEMKEKHNTTTERFSSFDDERSEEDCSTFMNLFLCVKYKNAGKLSSHNWFFNGFCR